MAVQGNDTYVMDQQWAKVRARKQALNGGFRIVIGDDPVDIQPGRLTFQQRRHIKQATGQSIDAWVAEIVTGQADADVLAGFLYCGFYQRSELDADGHPISVDDVMAMVQTLDDDTPIDIQFLGPDGEALTADEVEAQMADEPEPVEARTTAAAERGGLTFDPDDPTMPRAALHELWPTLARDYGINPTNFDGYTPLELATFAEQAAARPA